MLPEASVAWQLTVVVPTGKNEPDEGVQVTVGFGSRSSLAVTEYETFVPDASVASTVMSPGRLSVGGVTSGGGGGFSILMRPKSAGSKPSQCCSKVASKTSNSPVDACEISFTSNWPVSVLHPRPSPETLRPGAPSLNG